MRVWHALCCLLDNTDIDTQREYETMYSKAFFRTKLGQASIASIAAMTAMIALTSQMNLVSQDAHFAAPHGTSPVMVEMA